MYPDYQYINQSIREFYEAYVLYCFTRLLINYMGNEGQFSMALKASVSNTVITHTFPFCYLEPWEVSCRVLYIVSVVLVYCEVCLLTSCMMLII